MLRKILPAVIQALFLIAWCHLAVAQSNITGGGLFGDVKKGASYTGPGDIVSAATAWGSCARVYNVASASTSTSMCDIADVGTGAITCTLRGSSTGFVDLTNSYCAAGTLTPAAFCTAHTSCVVSKVYDQTGNGHPATQATLSAMPALTFSALNSLPCMTFVSGNSQNLLSSSFTGIAQPWSASVVGKRTVANFGGWVGGNANQEAILGNNSANTMTLFLGGTLSTYSNAGTTDNAFHAIQAVLNGTSSVTYADANQTTFASSPGASTATVFSLGISNGAFLSGTICEGGLWPVGFTTPNQSSINSNQHGTSGYNF